MAMLSEIDFSIFPEKLKSYGAMPFLILLLISDPITSDMILVSSGTKPLLSELKVYVYF